MQERFVSRDASLWMHQIRVENIQNLLGVLAGLNRLYFTTFQFKRMRAFIHQMRCAPANLADRLESLLDKSPSDASCDMESVIREVMALVKQEKPQLDLTAVEARLDRRAIPWKLG